MNKVNSIPGSVHNFSECHYNMEPWLSMAKAYKDASLLILDSIPDKENEIDDKIFPALFLFRHFIELSIKECLEICRITPSIDKQEYIYDHNLEKWFAKLSVPTTDFQELEACKDEINIWVKKFSMLDSDSFKFRYPLDRKNQKKHPFPLMERLNIKSINELRTAINHLDEAFGKLSMYCRARFDYEKEKRA